MGLRKKPRDEAREDPPPTDEAHVLRYPPNPFTAEVVPGRYLRILVDPEVIGPVWGELFASPSDAEAATHVQLSRLPGPGDYPPTFPEDPDPLPSMTLRLVERPSRTATRCSFVAVSTDAKPFAVRLEDDAWLRIVVEPGIAVPSSDARCEREKGHAELATSGQLRVPATPGRYGAVALTPDGATILTFTVWVATPAGDPAEPVPTVPAIDADIPVVPADIRSIDELR